MYRSQGIAHNNAPLKAIHVCAYVSIAFSTSETCASISDNFLSSSSNRTISEACRERRHCYKEDPITPPPPPPPPKKNNNNSLLNYLLQWIKWRIQKFLVRDIEEGKSAHWVWQPLPPNRLWDHLGLAAPSSKEAMGPSGSGSPFLQTSYRTIWVW